MRFMCLQVPWPVGEMELLRDCCRVAKEIGGMNSYPKRRNIEIHPNGTQ